MITGEDQITRFLSRVPSETVTEVDPDQPQVVFGSALELTREQEESLVDHLMQRFEELSSELGRISTAGESGVNAWYAEGGDEAQTTAKTFLGRRQLYEMVYNNQVEWRRYLLGGIYEEHNLVIPAARRVVQQQIARADNYFFGSDPWVTVFPVGTDDTEFASNLDRWIKFRFQQAGTVEAHKQANEGAFIRGEDVIKTSYRKTVDYHESFANVLLDPEGNPMIAEDGDYIFGDDEWIQDPDGNLVLRRDGKTMAPEFALMPGEDGGMILNPEWFEVRKINRALIKFDGSESKVVYYMDFLCPLDAPTIEEADCCVHIYEQPAIDVATMLLARSEQMPDDDKIPRLLEVLNNMAASQGESVAQIGKSRPEEGELGENEITGTDRINPKVNLGEFYVHFDPFGDGRGRRSIVVLVDLDHREPLFYDYVANVTPDGFRPLHVVRINPINGRWHGSGNMEVYWPIQEVIDLLANRWNMSQSGSARVDFWNPSATYEGDEDENLELNGGQTYTLKPNKRIEDALQSAYLTDIKSDHIHEQIQFFQQHLTNMSGVANANDSRSAGLDTAQLATGINNIQQSGEELFSPWLSHLLPGHRSAVRAAIKLEIKHMDKQSLFHYFEGTIRRLGEVSRSQLRDIELDVKIELTRFRTEREIIQSDKAYTVFHRFYSLPFELQQIWAMQARRTLSNLEIQDVESIIIPGMFTLAMVGLPPDPPAQGTTTGLGSQKPGVF